MTPALAAFAGLARKNRERRRSRRGAGDAGSVLPRSTSRHEPAPRLGSLASASAGIQLPLKLSATPVTIPSLPAGPTEGGRRSWRSPSRCTRHQQRRRPCHLPSSSRRAVESCERRGRSSRGSRLSPPEVTNQMEFSVSTRSRPTGSTSSSTNGRTSSRRTYAGGATASSAFGDRAYPNTERTPRWLLLRHGAVLASMARTPWPSAGRTRATSCANRSN